MRKLNAGYVEPPRHLPPPTSVYEWKRVLRRIKARRGRPNSKTADFYGGEALALDGKTVTITSAVKHVGTVMSDFADYTTGRNIMRSVEEIANGCDLDRMTVIRAIDTLRAIGMLWRGFRGSSTKDKCSEYQLVIARDLIDRVPLHPPTERNDQFKGHATPSRPPVDKPPPRVGPDGEYATPSRPPLNERATPSQRAGDSESPKQATPSLSSNPAINPLPTQHANTSPATAEVEGAGPARLKRRIPVDNPAERVLVAACEHQWPVGADGWADCPHGCYFGGDPDPAEPEVASC